MKRFYNNHKTIIQTIFLIFFWRFYLLLLQSISFLYPLRYGYLGFVPEANFDGVFYLNISQYSYRGLDQAFFPLYPIIIKLVTIPFSISPASSGMIVSIFSLFLLLFFFKKLIILDNLKKSSNWSLLFLLFFPTAFFFATIYTESLFLMLTITSFYLLRKKHTTFSVLLAICASATRIIGIFLLPAFLLEVYFEIKKEKKKVTLDEYVKRSWQLFLIPVGLFSYMAFLWHKYADPLLFVHIQPAFGAGRSGGEIVLLPQVIYRYVKIILTVPYQSQVFLISVLEISLFFLTCIILLLGYVKGVRKSYILFSVLAVIFPTLSGTLSSFPRYVLVCFAIFITLGMIKNRILKISLLFMSISIQSVLAVLFFRGYFVS